MGLAGFPSPALSQTINPGIVQKTLNPLPASVLIPSSAFTGSLISIIPAPGTGVDGVTAEVNFVWYGTSGDLTNDGYPEVAISGWSVRNGSAFNNAPGAPPTTPLYVLSTNASGTVQLDPQPLFGLSSLPGTTSPRILDLDKNGLNDFVYLGHNESPFTPTISQEFLQRAPGSFSTFTLPGPKIASHNSNVGDFNGDSYPDIVASTYMTDGTYFDPAFFAFGGTFNPVMILYINNRDGTFTPHAMRYTKPISQGPSQPDYGGGGSASAIGDVDGDGKPDIVIVDNTVLLPGTGITRGDTFLISNITLGNGQAYGDILKLPAPYFEDKPEYAGYPSQFTGQQSHDIHVDIKDINDDGRPDILVSSIIWSGGAGTSAGVLQILLNKGNRQFEDITDASLYNFFLGKGSGHQVEYMDVNGDGFPDIIMPEAGNVGPPVTTAPQTWANQVLINTGSGKFVQAMWNEFREMTLSQEQLVLGGSFLRQNLNYIPYLLPDRRLGFIAWQDVYFNSALNSVRRLGFFDFRAQTPLSTGPNGTDPASQGAPGFSEYFYLTEYPDVAAAVAAGWYPSGLAHYLATGRNEGRHAFAPNATIRGSAQFDTVTLNAPRSNFSLTKIAGGYQLKDNVGRYGTLKLLEVERAQFSDRTIDLGSPAAFGDHDGDGKTDVGVYRNGVWFILKSSNGGVTTVGWGGLAQDLPVPADYDGDGNTDIALYRDGQWYVIRSSDGGVAGIAFGGLPQDTPVPADYDGDGKTDIAIYRDGTWYIIRSSDGGVTVIDWGGLAQDKPVPADYDGDRKTDIAVYRDGTWFIRRSSDGGQTSVPWGGALADIPVPADYDGDGKSDPAVYRNGVWFILRSSDGGQTGASWGGLPQDVPVPADYDGDGRTDIAVYRSGIWFILQSSDAVQIAVGWGGAPQDVPLN